MTEANYPQLRITPTRFLNPETTEDLLDKIFAVRNGQRTAVDKEGGTALFVMGDRILFHLGYLLVMIAVFPGRLRSFVFGVALTTGGVEIGLSLIAPLLYYENRSLSIRFA